MNEIRNAGLVYLNVADKHLNHLVVSLVSLRDHYDGPVCILSGMAEAGTVSPRMQRKLERGHRVVQRIAADEHTGDVTIKQVTYGPKDSSYFLKTSMGEASPFDSTIFIDADTLVVDDFSDLWPTQDRIYLTSFADWTTKTGRIRGRIEKWEHILPDQVAQQMRQEVPAVNTGVMAFSKQPNCMEFMRRWKQVTSQNISFICDELACQLLYPEYPHLMFDERWNASPRYSLDRQGEGKRHKDLRILHGHGKKFLKNDPVIQERWWLPYYRRALSMNVAGIQEWTDKVGIRPRKYLSPRQWRRIWRQVKKNQTEDATANV